MNKLYYENLVKLYRKKDKLIKEIRSHDWDDAFTQQPECHANAQRNLVAELKVLENEIEVMNRQQL